MTSPWTPALEAKLIELWNSGMRTKQIGQKLNMTKSSIVSKRRRLDLGTRGSPIVRNTPVSDRAISRRKTLAPAPVTARTPRAVREVEVHQAPIKRHWSVTRAASRSEQKIRLQNGHAPLPWGMSRPALATTGVRFSTCQWIAAEIIVDDFAGHADSGKCGGPTAGGPYCAEHKARAYRPREAVACEDEREPSRARDQSC